MITGFLITLSDGTEWNSINNGIYMTSKPSIKLPDLQTESFNVAGRNSTLTYNYKAYQDREITISLVSKKYDNFKTLKKLIAKGMGGTIRFSYLDFDYKFKAGIKYSNRDAKGLPEVDLTLVIEPFGYLETQTVNITNSGFNVYNMSDMDSPFKIEIEYSGEVLLDLNKEELIINGSEKITIDSETLQIYNGNLNCGKYVVGDITKFLLKPGINVFEYVGNVSKMKVTFTPVIFE